MQHTYNVQHNRPLPDHMLEEHMAPKKKHKSDQLNFESETKLMTFNTSHGLQTLIKGKENHTGPSEVDMVGVWGIISPIVGIIHPLRVNMVRVRKVKIKAKVEAKAIKVKRVKAKVNRILQKERIRTEFATIVA